MSLCKLKIFYISVIFESFSLSTDGLARVHRDIPDRFISWSWRNHGANPLGLAWNPSRRSIRVCFLSTSVDINVVSDFLLHLIQRKGSRSSWWSATIQSYSATWILTGIPKDLPPFPPVHRRKWALITFSFMTFVFRCTFLRAIFPTLRRPHRQVRPMICCNKDEIRGRELILRDTSSPTRSTIIYSRTTTPWQRPVLEVPAPKSTSDIREIETLPRSPTSNIRRTTRWSRTWKEDLREVQCTRLVNKDPSGGSVNANMWNKRLCTASGWRLPITTWITKFVILMQKAGPPLT